jgi:hypothetical protein
VWRCWSRPWLPLEDCRRCGRWSPSVSPEGMSSGPDRLARRPTSRSPRHAAAGMLGPHLSFRHAHRAGERRALSVSPCVRHVSAWLAKQNSSLLIGGLEEGLSLSESLRPVLLPHAVHERCEEPQAVWARGQGSRGGGLSAGGATAAPKGVPASGCRGRDDTRLRRPGSASPVP